MNRKKWNLRNLAIYAAIFGIFYKIIFPSISWQAANDNQISALVGEVLGAAIGFTIFAFLVGSIRNYFVK